MSKVKGIKIFDNRTTNGESQVFRVITPDSKGFSDTEHSVYLSFYGNKGGGTISLMKLMLDDSYKKLVLESAKINTNFPTNADEAYIVGLNHKADSKFKIDLAGATTPTLFVDGEGFEFVPV